jgi:hypothetical protein
MLVYRFYTFILHTGTTLAIITKLLHHRSAMIKVFGPGHGQLYLNMISILVESAAVIVVYGLMVLVPGLLHHPIFVLGGASRNYGTGKKMNGLFSAIEFIII